MLTVAKRLTEWLFSSGEFGSFWLLLRRGSWGARAQQNLSPPHGKYFCVVKRSENHSLHYAGLKHKKMMMIQVYEIISIRFNFHSTLILDGMTDRSSMFWRQISKLVSKLSLFGCLFTKLLWRRHKTSMRKWFSNPLLFLIIRSKLHFPDGNCNFFISRLAEQVNVNCSDSLWKKSSHTRHNYSHLNWNHKKWTILEYTCDIISELLLQNVMALQKKTFF